MVREQAAINCLFPFLLNKNDVLKFETKPILFTFTWKPEI